MNKVIMMGRLTRDPETRYGQGATGVAVGNFSIAVDRRFKREEDFRMITIQTRKARKYIVIVYMLKI